MAEDVFDVVIVGGGVTGVGTALDAATRGLSVALVEATDFAAGTSSRSSKLIHGGLRYLEQRNFALVREALQERSLLLTGLAPHLVRPVSFLYPLQHKYWERFYVGTGVLLYDIMGEARALLPVPPRPATRTRCTTPTSTTFQTPTNPAARRPGASVTEHRRDTPAPRDLTRGQYVDGAALDERGRCRPLEQVLQSAALVTDRDATPIGARAGRMLGGE
jgi:glycine/D-amino acid oxidase-like deaminating enzyme